MDWMYVFIIPGLVSGIPAFLTFFGRAVSLLMQWRKFKLLRKSQSQKRKSILAFVDNLRYPGVDRDANPGHQHMPESNLTQAITATCYGASNLNQCDAVDPSVVAAVEDGLGLANLDSGIFDLASDVDVRLDTRPCLCGCAVDLVVWIWACLSITIGFAAMGCSDHASWNPLFVLGIAAILILADVLFFIVAFMYNRSKPGSWKYLSVLYILMVLQHVMIISVFFTGLKKFNIFIIFAPLFLEIFAILFLLCVFYGAKKGVLITTGMGIPLVASLTLICLKADLLFNDAPMLPKGKFISWLDTYWPVWSILVLWPMIAWLFDRLLRCDTCIEQIDHCFLRIKVWFWT